jgi:hypothetical protein
VALKAKEKRSLLGKMRTVCTGEERGSSIRPRFDSVPAMPTLKNQIATLADSFAAGVLAAIRSASLEDILEGGSAPAAPARRGPGRPPKSNGVAAAAAPSLKPAKRGKGGRLARRSASDIEHVIGLIVGKLGEHKTGLRSEQLQKALKLSKKEIVGPLNQGLAARKITKKGERRSTTYFAAR